MTVKKKRKKSKTNNWYDVNKKGLSQILGRRSKAFVVYEMVQNAWDQNVSKVEVALEPIKGRRCYRLVVKDDDPEGFKDISHAFTLFAESYKKDDPTKRGRFNIGEKFVLAFCEEAEIITTTGSVIFQKDGQRRSSRKNIDKGSIFSANIVMTKDEYQDVCDAVNMLIPPPHIDTYFNGIKLHTKEPIRSFEATLQTEISGVNGILRKSYRKTDVEVYSVENGEKAHLYELGIPVVETGDTFHVNIKQKIPLNMERNNVTPAYIRKIRTVVFNHTYELITQDTVNETWVKEAVSNSECDPAAFEKYLDLRFGKKRVIFDPSDSESNKKAVSNGCTLIYPRQLSKAERANAKKTHTTLPAGQVFPTPHLLAGPDGEPPIPYEQLTEKQKLVVGFTKELAKRIMAVGIEVKVFDMDGNWDAAYGNREFSFNLKRLGADFFEDFPDNLIAVLAKIIHEFGHEYSGDHLSSEYHKALCKLGAKMALLARDNPGFFYITWSY